MLDIGESLYFVSIEEHKWGCQAAELRALAARIAVKLSRKDGGKMAAMVGVVFCYDNNNKGGQTSESEWRFPCFFCFVLVVDYGNFWYLILCDILQCLDRRKNGKSHASHTYFCRLAVR